MIYQAADKNNSNLNRALMGRFQSFLDDTSLNEIPLHGRKFTLSNERDSPTLVRLDRVFCCSEWEEFFPDSLLQSASSGVSDHCPLILGLKVNVQKKRRFHFECFWPKLPGFVEAVSQNWSAPVSSRCPVECIFLKLQRLSKGLQSWSQRKVGNIRLQLEMAKEILHRLEIARDTRGLSPGEEWLRRKLKHHSLGLASLERTIAKQRSRLLYLREGDANTSFFHKQARYRKKKNFIAKFQDGNQVFTAQEDKQQAALEFYENLIGSAEERCYSLDFATLGVQQHDLVGLDSPFSLEETWAVVKELPLDKAPGPDGFTGRFYKVCWDIIKDDVMAALLTVQRGHTSKFKLLNSAFITLIPKKADALHVKDYRLISLIHSFAKLVSKLLATRLAPHLPSLVSFN
ncbi:hypothetical protein BS78_03G145500 [Paspalum vaginatum]|nr:hypothetical protein BS78_03G145500 [Paspalum vaginatum]